jgi:hypothetical protein
MGLLNPATTTFNKLNSVDKRIVEGLVLVENSGYSSMRRYAGINNTCDLLLKRHGMDLSRSISDAEALELTIAEAGQTLKDLELRTEKLRDAYHQSLNAVREQKVVLEANSDLYKERMDDVGVLSMKYAFTEWIQANPEPLASATVEEARSFVGCQSQEHVRLLNMTACVQKLRLLKRLGWDKSDFMVRGFGGALLIKPRDGTPELAQDLLIAYLRLAPDAEMKQAALVLHKEHIQPDITTSTSTLFAILEDEEGEDPATTAKKRQVREMVEELLSPKKKQCR